MKRLNTKALLWALLALGLLVLLLVPSLVRGDTKDPQEELEETETEAEQDEPEVMEQIIAPHCDPQCDSKHYCNFLGHCEPYPILLMECDAGSSCDGCHCSGKCTDGVCQ